MWWTLVSKVADLPDPKGPFPQPSNQQVSDFYVRLGIAVAAWQIIENDLVYTYGRTIRTEDFKSLAASFHTPISFRVRLDMTDAAIDQSAVSEVTKQEWKKLYERLGRQAKRRNLIAHSLVLFDPKRTNLVEQLFLAPHLTNPAKAPVTFKKGEVLHQSNLDEMIATFKALQLSLQKFNQALIHDTNNIEVSAHGAA